MPGPVRTLGSLWIELLVAEVLMSPGGKGIQNQWEEEACASRTESRVLRFVHRF